MDVMIARVPAVAGGIDPPRQTDQQILRSRERQTFFLREVFGPLDTSTVNTPAGS